MPFQKRWNMGCITEVYNTECIKNETFGEFFPTLWKEGRVGVESGHLTLNRDEGTGV